MTEKERKELIGEIGEKHVIERLGGTLSEDKYDTEKDLTLPNGQKAEVKTQARWKTENSFTVDETYTNNNLRKCLNVEKLFFVEPGKNRTIRIYEALSREYRIKYPRNIETYLFSVNNMKLIDEVKDEEKWANLVSLIKTKMEWLS